MFKFWKIFLGVPSIKTLLCSNKDLQGLVQRRLKRALIFITQSLFEASYMMMLLP